MSTRNLILFSAAQLFGEVLFGLLAGGAGVMAYRSATTVLKRRTVVVLRSLPRSGSQARWYHRYVDTV